MSQLFSFLGNYLGAAHIYSKIYSMPEFRDFTDYLNEGTSIEVLTQFFRNLFATFLDPYVNELLQSNEFNTIFNNDKLTRQEQCKLFAGKVFNKLYDQYADELKDHIQVDKRVVLEILIMTFNDIQHLDKAENGNDCYTLLLNFYANTCATFVKSFCHNALTSVNEETLLEYTATALGAFNVVYEYDSKHINEDLLDNIRDDFTSDDDDDGDNDDGDNNDNENGNNDNNNNDDDDDDGDTGDGDDCCNNDQNNKRTYNNVTIAALQSSNSQNNFIIDDIEDADEIDIIGYTPNGKKLRCE